MTKSPWRWLRRRVSKAAGLPGIRERQERQHQRLLELNRRITDTSKNLEHRAVVDEQRIRSLVAAEVAAIHEAITQTARSAERAVRDGTEAMAANFENRLTSLNDRIVEHVEHARSIDRSRTDKAVADLRRAIDVLRSSQTVTGSTSKLSARDTPRPLASPIDDGLYVDLEDAFRGSRDLVAERQRNYLEVISRAPVSSGVLDLGCGRGEWLQILAGAGIKATGVDSNALALDECRRMGLDVQSADLTSFLKGLEGKSVGVVTLFQVIEHLPFESVVETLREIRRVLVDSGVMILEVPNAKNARVASGTFWIDPTHERPWYPDLLEYVASTVGFSTIEGRYVNRLMDAPDLAGVDERVAGPLLLAFDAIYGPADFALIATA